jgi:hypothetical protein
VDDVNDMNESMDRIEGALGSSLRRRDFLTKAAAAGTIAWVAPVILSRPAYALDGGGGTPNCRPTFTFECITYDCQQGSKMMPGFRVVTTSCPCSHTVPPQRPITCIKITKRVADGGGPGVVATCATDPVVYGSGTTCGPNSPPDVILSTGNWTCFDASFPVWFGRPRSGGAIPAIPSDCTFTFRLGVWAGNCPDRKNPTEAFTCQTYNVTIVWNQGTKTVTSCIFTPAPASETLCTNVPANVSPCGSCP